MPLHFLLSADEMLRADALAAKAGVSGAQLMEKAGEAVAAAAIAAGKPRPVAVLCGPGNNGGDGFVAARLLKEKGWPVRLGLLGARDALKGDAALMASLFDGAVEPLTPAVLADARLIIDAIYGAGLSRAVSGEAAATIEAANASSAPVLAVDLPSGVDADTGRATGPAIRAAKTVTFFLKKPAHVLFPGRALCGTVEVADIGISEQVLSGIHPKTVENYPAVWAGAFRRPSFAAHKYTRGHAAVVAGPRFRTGAARLAARGALRSGAGLVTMLASPDAAIECAAHLTAIMLKEADSAEAVADILSDKRFTAALIGPGAGVGDTVKEATLAILRSGAAAVLDADALTNFETYPDKLFKALRPTDVLTPHEGEFGRLFPSIDVEAVGKLQAARDAASQSGAVIVLKGADTVVAAPDGRAVVNTNAPPDLATAGSGDVLAGFILGHMAQGMPTFEAAAAAVWLHGACGQVAGAGLIAEDLPDALPSVLRTLLSPDESKETGR